FELAGWQERMPGKGAGELAQMWYAEHAGVYADLRACYDDPSFLKIAIVRDPLFRAVSSFTVVTDSKSGAQWRAVAKSLASPDDERRLTFLEFLDFLESGDLATANYHWRLQTAQDWYDLGLPDVRLVRLESIQEGLDEVCRHLGKQPLPLRINSAQSTSRTKLSQSEIVNFTRADFAQAFGHDKRGVIRFPEYSKFLTAETVARLGRLYERDFVRLGYEPSVPQQENWSAKLHRLLHRR
ncbi:MAG TPA: sulfotransferase family 2 domain-containing protein, partial [Acidobacteriaceae bacterium]|nr:sulfotransferase family 2 domain-containing protein [Acidobacteriaceae bacterium]